MDTGQKTNLGNYFGMMTQGIYFANSSLATWKDIPYLSNGLLRRENPHVDMISSQLVMFFLVYLPELMGYSHV